MIHPLAPSVKFRTIDKEGIMYICRALMPSPGLIVIDQCWRVGMTTPERVEFKDLPIVAQDEILKDAIFRHNNDIIDDIELPSDWEEFTCEGVSFTYHVRSKYVLEDVNNAEEAMKKFGMKHITRIKGNVNDWKEYLVYSAADWPTTAADLKAAIIF